MPESCDLTAEHARAAAQIEADVGVEHIARVYAKALVDSTERAGETAAVVDAFDAVMGDVLGRYPKLEAVLASSLISSEEKSGLIDRVFGGRAPALLVDFLKVVARHERLDCLRAIHCETRAIVDRLRHRVPVQLSTAGPLGAAEVRRIAEGLRGALGGEPVFEHRTDPALIGGAVLRVGDTVYDGSVANQLNHLRQQMIERTAHEVQSRRDRFRHSAGN